MTIGIVHCGTVYVVTVMFVGIVIVFQKFETHIFIGFAFNFIVNVCKEPL